MRNTHTLHGTSLSSGRKPWGTLDKYLGWKGLAQLPSSTWVLQEKHRVPIQVWHPLAIFLWETVQLSEHLVSRVILKGDSQSWVPIRITWEALKHPDTQAAPRWVKPESPQRANFHAWSFFTPGDSGVWPRWEPQMWPRWEPQMCSHSVWSSLLLMQRGELCMHECNPRSHPRSGTLYYPPRFTVEETASVQGHLAQDHGVSHWLGGLDPTVSNIDCILTHCTAASLSLNTKSTKTQDTWGKGTTQRNNTKIRGRKQKIQICRPS